MQRRGTARVGRLFGPVMILWFGALAVMGVRAILRRRRSVLAALNPTVRARRCSRHTRDSRSRSSAPCSWSLTGGEALYADMGHFGRMPVRLAWFTIVWPGLLLNYFGQGALLLANPQAAANPVLRARARRERCLR